MFEHSLMWNNLFYRNTKELVSFCHADSQPIVEGASHGFATIVKQRTKNNFESFTGHDTRIYVIYNEWD